MLWMFLKSFTWVYLKLWINFLHDFITQCLGLLEILIHWIMEILQTLTNLLYNSKKSHWLTYHWFHQKSLKYWEAVMLTSGYKLYQILIFPLKLKTLPLAIFIISCFQQPVLEHRDSIKLILPTGSSVTFLNETDVFCFVF